MRGLIVGAAPALDRSAIPLVARLAAETELVIAVDGGGEHCLAASVTPSLVVGDLDSLSDASELRLKADGAVVARFARDKDETDLDLALVEAKAAGVSALTLTCVLGGRLDHTLATLSSLARSLELAPHVVETHVRVWTVDATFRPELELHEPGTRISILPLAGPARVSATGVRWPLDGELLATTSTLGVSNVLHGTPSRIAVSDGSVLVIADDRP